MPSEPETAERAGGRDRRCLAEGKGYSNSNGLLEEHGRGDWSSPQRAPQGSTMTGVAAVFVFGGTFHTHTHNAGGAPDARCTRIWDTIIGGLATLSRVGSPSEWRARRRESDCKTHDDKRSGCKSVQAFSFLYVCVLHLARAGACGHHVG